MGPIGSKWRRIAPYVGDSAIWGFIPGGEYFVVIFGRGSARRAERGLSDSDCGPRDKAKNADGRVVIRRQLKLAKCWRTSSRHA
jgi:hypothetical protein